MKKKPIIALVFDFDDTLAHDSTSTFLEMWGVNVREFWQQHAKLLKSGWDPIPAYLEMMLEESRLRPAKQQLTAQLLRSAAKKIKYHQGVPAFFERLKNQVAGEYPQVSLEFYVVSSGIKSIIEHSKVAPFCKQLWASDFAYDKKSGLAVGLKNVISFTDKTRYLFQIVKGLVGKSANDPFAVNRRSSPQNIRVNWENLIMVGDGYTDVPCFALVQQAGGTAIGVYDRHSRERWGKAWGFLEDNRVRHLVAADFRPQSGLDDAIRLAVDRVCRTISVKEISFK